MDLAIDITSSSRVRVLLVPVSPIKKSKFWKHVELVKKFNVVRLGDVTPDMQQGSGAMFSSQVFQEGQMHFQFLTNYKRDHVHLEDFQPNRRIFGVIGIMDCQEWKDRDLGEGYQHFVETLGKYPTAIATRCFAFDPTENQPDDTKGLIMIPNVGEMSFYMSTMICDFASEILSQFEIIAGRIKELDTIESPTPPSYVIHRHDPMKKIAPQPSSSSPSGGKPNRASQPPVPTQSTSSFMKRASTTSGNPPPTYKSPQLSMSRSSSAHGIGADVGKIKRCTPGRIKKLLADFYLLAGRLPDAVRLYNQALEIAKTLGDHLWLASAIEGLACASLLMEYLQVNVGDIIPRGQSLMPSNSSDSSDSAASTPPSESKSTLTDMLEHYTTVIAHYNKMGASGMVVPDIVFAEACAKMARFLLTVYLHGGWNDQVLSLLVQGVLSDAPLPLQNLGEWDSNAMAKYKYSNIPKYDIAKWAMKTIEVCIDQQVDFSVLDQVNLMTHMAAVLSTIGYHRKASWMLHESVQRMLPLLIQSRATLASSREQTKRNIGKSDTGILDVLKHICEVYGIGERIVQDGGGPSEVPGSNVQNLPQNKLQRFGWPDLQIIVLRQCVAISEALPDYASMLYYTTVLLKNLYQYISKEEQIRLASNIQRIVAMGKRSGHVESNVNYWGVNIVSSIEASEPISRKAVYEHPILTKDVAAMAKESGTSDPFIYNPFAKKKEEKYKVNLVKGESCEFKVCLTNPFAFDLELQNITLSTSGVSFTAVSASATIPASGTLALRLTGTPEEAGVMTIRGCVIKIVGFAEQEFLVDLSQSAKKGSPESRKGTGENKGGFVKLKRSGLSAIQSSDIRGQTRETISTEFYTLNVIDDQPLLKIQSTSLLHGALELYEGEMTQMSLKLENIGTIPVDVITLSFTDSTSFHPQAGNQELSMEEQYEIGLFIKGTRVFSWEGSGKEAAESVKKVWLPPGKEVEIIVNVYGKRDCTSGTIQVDYGYLDRVIHQNVDDTLPSPSDEAPMRPPVTAMFYTRQLYLPVLVTVHKNLEPVTWDVLYLRPNVLLAQKEIDEALKKLRKHAEPTNEQPIEDLLKITRQVQNKQDKNDYCLVTLDVRNTWTVPFKVEFSVSESDGDTHPVISSLIIQPGWTKRLTLPVKRLFLNPDTCLAPIPSFEPNKQFVVSHAPKTSDAQLQMFWYCETLLKRLKATWCCTSTGRKGLIHLRPSLRLSPLSPLQLSILKKEDIEFLVDVEGAKSVGHRQFACETENFVSMKVSIHNRQVRPIKLILRIQPVQSYNDGAKEPRVSEKLLMHGFSQAVLQEIPADGVATHTVPLCFLSRGRFEFLYHVEDVHTREVHYDHDWAIVDVEKSE